MATCSLQDTTSLCCKQGSRNFGKFFHGSMERCQRYQQILAQKDVHQGPQEAHVSERAGMAPDR